MNFNQVVAYYGTAVKAAKALKTSRATLYRWKDEGIPIDVQIDCELDSKGFLRADLPKAIRMPSE